MRIWKNYYRLEVSELETVKYENLPKDGKRYSKGSQDFKDTLGYIVSCYSYLIEGVNRQVTASELADLIKKHYSLDNLRNKFAYEFLLNC